MGYTGKLMKKKTLEKFLQKNMFRKTCLKDCITGVQRKAIKKNSRKKLTT